MTLENGKLVQKQSWDGKTTILEREIKDGKLIAVSCGLLQQANLDSSATLKCPETVPFGVSAFL